MGIKTSIDFGITREEGKLLFVEIIKKLNEHLTEKQKIKVVKDELKTIDISIENHPITVEFKRHYPSLSDIFYMLKDAVSENTVDYDIYLIEALQGADKKGVDSNFFINTYLQTIITDDIICPINSTFIWTKTETIFDKFEKEYKQFLRDEEIKDSIGVRVDREFKKISVFPIIKPVIIDDLIPGNEEPLKKVYNIIGIGQKSEILKLNARRVIGLAEDLREAELKEIKNTDLTESEKKEIKNQKGSSYTILSKLQDAFLLNVDYDFIYINRLEEQDFGIGIGLEVKKDNNQISIAYLYPKKDYTFDDVSIVLETNRILDSLFKVSGIDMVLCDNNLKQLKCNSKQGYSIGKDYSNNSEYHRVPVNIYGKDFIILVKLKNRMMGGM